MLIGVRGCGRGLRRQLGVVHPFSIHVALNCKHGLIWGTGQMTGIESMQDSMYNLACV